VAYQQLLPKCRAVAASLSGRIGGAGNWRLGSGRIPPAGFQKLLGADSPPNSGKETVEVDSIHTIAMNSPVTLEIFSGSGAPPQIVLEAAEAIVIVAHERAASLVGRIREGGK